MLPHVLGVGSNRVIRRVLWGGLIYEDHACGNRKHKRSSRFKYNYGDALLSVSIQDVTRYNESIE